MGDNTENIRSQMEQSRALVEKNNSTYFAASTS